ncbi:melibiose:sodium transporter MelB [Microbacterium pseudoresistens]|uniref:Melibiose permease/lactose/raffinose/galactose permease n=1 Tax=Microbacterium pseudoresistens TaxID=640634 RepID=A0A7Y9ET14_9MICO|nr:melibiose permease/lactose/raffinose/galactose permease [Microbacterium pseudoresistens]
MTAPGPHVRRTRYGYGIGTLGRDLSYTLVSMYLIFYLSDVLEVSAGVLAAVTVVLVIARVFDAVNDPFMGLIVDNTRSRWGRFRPWIVVGAVLSCLFLVLMFTDFGLDDAAFVVVFTVVYVAWEISYTMNDLGYWSMLPALTQDQDERERIGAFARICANIGVFSMVVAIVPVSNALAAVTGDLRSAYTVIALAAAVLMLVFQTVMVLLVREDPTIPVPSGATKLRELFRIIVRNDQLLVAGVAMLLFMSAFSITTGLGLFYFKYVFGDEGVYSVFAVVLGVAQIAALACFPLLSRLASRRTLFTASVACVALGYVLFSFTPPGALAMIVIAGLLIFSAQAAIQLLMLMFIADTVEYGHWKLGSRNDSITLSLQPFVYKMAAAVSNGVIGWTVIASGMQEATGAADMSPEGTTLIRGSMFWLPLILIVLSYLVYRIWYRLDAARYARIVEELRLRAHDVAPREGAIGG